MEEQTTEGHIRCRTCGDYVPKSEAVNDLFCSNFCTRKYTRCAVCGKFFLKNSTMEHDICSPECREKFDYTPDEKFLQRLKGAVK